MPERDMSVKSLHKAARLLDCFTREHPSWTLSQLASQLRMHPTTAFRLLATLQELGYVSHDPRTRHYRLGLKVLELGARVLAGMDPVREAEGLLHDLAADTGESSYLSIHRDGMVVYVAAVDSAQMIKTSATIGEQRPLHSTGSGKLFLAFMSAEERSRHLQGFLSQRGPNTITDTRVLESELALIREQGFAVSYEEDHVGLVSTAAPVFGREGLVASLSLAGPAFRLPRETLVGLSSRVVEDARTLSSRLGAPGLAYRR